MIEILKKKPNELSEISIIQIYKITNHIKKKTQKKKPSTHTSHDTNPTLYPVNVDAETKTGHNPEVWGDFARVSIDAHKKTGRG